MEPTVTQQDAFVVGPALTVNQGDVIVFDQSDTRSGFQEPTVHRVVGQTDRGYITKGDANPTTDQKAGSPPVTEDQILGKVVTLGGTLLIVSDISRPLQLVSENARIVVPLLLVLFLYPLIGREDTE